MPSQAIKYQTSQVDLVYGRVLGLSETGFQVETNYGRMTAEPAASCLVLPRAGDRVLMSCDSQGDAFILAILCRDYATSLETDIAFNGPVNIHVAHGDLTLFADQDLCLTAGNEMAWTGTKVKLQANQVEAQVEKVSLVGKFLHTQFERIKAVALSVDHVFESLVQRMDESYRYVKNHEEIQAGSARYLVEDTLTMHSKNAVHMAEEIVKLNAQQVHLG